MERLKTSRNSWYNDTYETLNATFNQKKYLEEFSLSGVTISVENGRKITQDYINETKDEINDKIDKLKPYSRGNCQILYKQTYFFK